MQITPINRKYKGKSLFILPMQYTVVDIETNGYMGPGGDIIEIGAIRYQNGVEVARFNTFLQPRFALSSFITNLTGITNAMVANAPAPALALKEFYTFLGDDVIVGYNVNFDVNFLYDKLLKYNGLYLTNDFVDVLRFSRKALPNLCDHKQTTVSRYFGLSTEGAHRATKDCQLCNDCYVRLASMLDIQPCMVW